MVVPLISIMALVAATFEILFNRSVVTIAARKTPVGWAIEPLDQLSNSVVASSGIAVRFDNLGPAILALQNRFHQFTNSAVSSGCLGRDMGSIANFRSTV
jgi:hypothetical protein